MKTQQYHYANAQLRNGFVSPGFNPLKAQLVLAFGEASLITDVILFNQLKSLFPSADIVFSSTAGEIMSDDVYEDSVVITAIEFEKTSVRWISAKEAKFNSAQEIGKYLMTELYAEDLTNVFVLADGTCFNGSELVEGLNENNRLSIPVTGGMAGDGVRFVQTFIGVNQLPENGMAVAIGFYGNNLKIGHGSFGGWDEFGPEKTVTRAEKNIVYEIDGKNAFDLYNEYLGSAKTELPMNALMFPLAIKRVGADQDLIRTVTLINEQEKTMQVGGNLLTGSKVQFMKANFEHLINGSSVAAANSLIKLTNSKPDLAILVSCIGRKLILQKRSDEEVLAAMDVLGDSFPITGFYSYGEFSPMNSSIQCEHHNQTMTITTFSES